MPVYLNIIDVLGSRLYSGKVSWLREYVQNSIDARSEKIIIKLKDKDLSSDLRGNFSANGISSVLSRYPFIPGFDQVPFISSVSSVTAEPSRLISISLVK